VRAASAGDPLDDAGDLFDREPRAGDVVHEGHRHRAVHQDVVHAVVDEVLAHRIETLRL